jgi:hypothetical protein
VSVPKFPGVLRALARKVIVIIFGAREAHLHSISIDRMLIIDANFPLLPLMIDFYLDPLLRQPI